LSHPPTPSIPRVVRKAVQAANQAIRNCYPRSTPTPKKRTNLRIMNKAIKRTIKKKKKKTKAKKTKRIKQMIKVIKMIKINRKMISKISQRQKRRPHRTNQNN